MKTVVLGGSGFLGMNLVRCLLDHEVAPTCVYRGRVPRLSLRRTEAPVVQGDFEDRDGLTAAFQDADLVFHFGAHYHALSLDREATLQTGLRQLDNVLEAGAAAGIARLVFVSSVGTVKSAGEEPSTEQDTFERPPGFGVYHDLKWHLERRLSQETRFETLTLCPGACLGPWDVRIGTSMMLVATARGERVPHPDGWVNIADARDVAEIAYRAALLDEMPTRLLVSGGDYRLHDLLTTLATRYDAPPPEEPLDATEAVRRADAEERAAAAEGRRASMSRELVDLTIHGNRIDASLSTRVTGHAYRPLEDTLSAFDEWARARNIIPKLTLSEE